MKLLIKLISIVILFLILCSCAVRHGDFTVLSNRLINTQHFDLNDPDRQPVIGKDVRHVLIFIPTSGPPTLEGALDNAFNKSGGDVLTDAVIKWWDFYIPFLYGQTGWKVEGTALKTRK